VIDVSVLNVDTAAIINPQNTTFTLALTGVVRELTLQRCSHNDAFSHKRSHIPGYSAPRLCLRKISRFVPCLILRQSALTYISSRKVSWLNGTDEVPLGYMSLDTLSAKSKRAYINQTTTFIIQEQENFGAFTG
jgi:hypothetical protein